MFFGWLKERGGTWRRTCEAPSEAECWRLLLKITSPSGSERLVNRGKHPDNRKRPR